MRLAIGTFVLVLAVAFTTWAILWAVGLFGTSCRYYEAVGTVC